MSRYILSLRDYRFCVICLFICIYFIVCKASKKTQLDVGFCINEVL